jgi:O-antigen biosynthesis protein
VQTAVRSTLRSLLRAVTGGRPPPTAAPTSAPPPVAQRSRWSTDPISIASDRAVALSPPAGQPDPSALRLHWILPDAANRSGGGHLTLFRLIRHLERRGHRQHLWVRPPWFHANPREALVTFRAYQPLGETVEVAFLPDDVSAISGDAVIATDWWTVYPAIAVSRVRERFYLVQDLESSFQPMGAEALLAEQTYRLGLRHLCAGRWLHELMQTRYGGWSWQWDLASDPTYYYPVPGQQGAADPATSGPRIAFYYRAETPRRAVQLGLAAFKSMHEQGVAFSVDFFGSPAPSGLPYPHRDHGVLAPAELGALYRSVDLGLVFSATNYSLVPIEMMACGLAVAELQGESTDATFPSGSVLRLPPWPPAMAERLATALTDPQGLAAQRAIAQDFITGLSWETTGDTLEQGLREGLRIGTGMRGTERAGDGTGDVAGG